MCSIILATEASNTTRRFWPQSSIHAWSRLSLAAIFGASQRKITERMQPHFPLPAIPTAASTARQSRKRKTKLEEAIDKKMLQEVEPESTSVWLFGDGDGWGTWSEEWCNGCGLSGAMFVCFFHIHYDNVWCFYTAELGKIFELKAMCRGALSALLQNRCDAQRSCICVGMQLLNKPVGKSGFKRLLSNLAGFPQLPNSSSVEANFNDKATTNQLVNWHKPSTSTSRMITAAS